MNGVLHFTSGSGRVSHWVVRFAVLLGVLFLTTMQSHATRIKDMVLIEGGRDNQLVGYGLVTGLANKGDSQLNYTVQSIANALQRFGVQVSPSTLKSQNVAAVMVTADIPAFAKPGSRIDVTVSAIGDATTIQGGVLLQTPLLGADDVVYAVAQGPLAVGGFLAGSSSSGGGSSVQKNHPTVGVLSGGALVEREVAANIVNNNSVNLLLLNPDYASAARIAEAVNNVFPRTAVAKDASTVNVCVPKDYCGYEVNFIASLGAIETIPDNVARVVINERTGTIIATSNVRISTVAVSHGSLTISIVSTPVISQPASFTSGQTVTSQTSETQANEKKGGFKVVEELPTIQEVAAALNALGLSTLDMMAIFQTMKKAGALQADLILN